MPLLTRKVVHEKSSDKKVQTFSSTLSMMCAIDIETMKLWKIICLRIDQSLPPSFKNSQSRFHCASSYSNDSNT